MIEKDGYIYSPPAWKVSSRWIPVIEDTPHVGNEVLGWTDGMYFIGMYVAGCELMDDNGIRFEITHWQPLPQPPEDRRPQ